MIPSDEGPFSGGIVLSSGTEWEVAGPEVRAHSLGASLWPVADRTMDFYHQPVLSEEVYRAMRPVRGKQIFDGTLGGGGHAELLLRHGAHVIGCDRDGDALQHASRRLDRYGDCFLPVRGNFSEIDRLLADHAIDSVDGILLDLGVSSRQLDEPSRGFSFREDGPLDMRMDQRQERSARDIVNEAGEEELADIFYRYGEERASRRIAREIVRERERKVIATTAHLAEVIARVLPRSGARHPATRSFQGLRIAVNEELAHLEVGLEKAVGALAEGGVLAVITFHSLEDRIVKHFLRERSQKMIDRPEWPEPRPNPDYSLALRNRKAVAPTEEEISHNPRARSAKLRVAVKM